MASLLPNLTRAEAVEVLDRLAADMARWIEALPSRRGGDPDVGHKIERLREQRAAVLWAVARLRRAVAIAAVSQASSLEPHVTGSHLWAYWIEVNRAAGRPDPAKIGPDLKAAALLAEILPADKAEAILRAYLADQDPFLVKQGWPLRLLQQRVNAYAGTVGRTLLSGLRTQGAPLACSFCGKVVPLRATNGKLVCKDCEPRVTCSRCGAWREHLSGSPGALVCNLCAFPVDR